jgi:hypothetical protein
MTFKYDLIGRKAIMAFLRLAGWKMVKARIAKGMPVIREPPPYPDSCGQQECFNDMQGFLEDADAWSTK